MLKVDDKHGGDDYYDGEVYNADNKDLLWVVGVYQYRKHGQFVRIQERTKHTLTCVIKFISHLEVAYVRVSLVRIRARFRALHSSNGQPFRVLRGSCDQSASSGDCTRVGEHGKLVQEGTRKSRAATESFI